MLLVDNFKGNSIISNFLYKRYNNRRESEEPNEKYQSKSAQISKINLRTFMMSVSSEFRLISVNKFKKALCFPILLWEIWTSESNELEKISSRVSTEISEMDPRTFMREELGLNFTWFILISARNFYCFWYCLWEISTGESDERFKKISIEGRKNTERALRKFIIRTSIDFCRYLQENLLFLIQAKLPWLLWFLF